MHTIDIIFSIIGLILIVIGIKRGFTGELSRIIAMIMGVIIAFLYYDNFTPYLSVLKVPLTIKNAVAFLLVYIIVVFVIIFIGWIIKKAINLTVLGWVDRFLGAMVGLVKTFLLAWIVCLSIASFPVKRVQNDLSNSIVFKMYKKLPNTLHVKAIKRAKDTIRDMMDSKEPESIDKNEEISQSIHTKPEPVKHKNTKKVKPK